MAGGDNGQAGDFELLPDVVTTHGGHDLSHAVAAALAAVEALQREPTPSPTPPAEPMRGDLRQAMLDLQQAQAELAEERQKQARLQGELTQAQADLSATRRRYQRLDQECEELRKRLQRNEMDLPQLAARNFLTTLLPVLDDLDTLFDHLARQETLSAHGDEAVAMLRDHLQKAMQALQVQTFDAVGQRFDPTVHEVIAQVTDATVPAGTVVRQMARGYLHAGRLVRSARVVVSKS